MDTQARQKMRIRVDFNNMMSEYIGKEGIEVREIERMAPRIARAAQAMEENDNQGWQRWRGLPYNQEQILQDILKTAAEVRENYENFVVLGIGGSALGPIAVQQALNHLHYNDLPAGKRGGPRLFVEDNVDPERMAALLDVIDVRKTCFNVITKSGSTSETMSQLLIAVDLLKKAVGEDWGRQVIATTDQVKGNLRKIADENGLKTYIVPDGVGGRFSELCPVGLLPAAVCGIDILQMIEGARYMDEICREKDVWKNPAYMMAVLQVISMEKGRNISVMMPYADSLKYIADWYAQLWAESLGKSSDRQGNTVNVGQTPVKALGVTDQHSQVQLYTEGPYDKVVTFLGLDRYRCEFPIPQGFEHLPDVAFLSGHTLNELIQAEQMATEYAISTKAGRPSHTIILPEVNAFTIGQLLYLFEIETAFAGELLDIDAFDQPGVEAGKQATYALLNKQGYDEKRAELNARPVKSARYIL
jgi:glucose-6-phosphate isomerase